MGVPEQPPLFSYVREKLHASRYRHARRMYQVSLVGVVFMGVVNLRSEFIVTASCDGHVKFWKKQEEGVEFVKHFRAHLGERDREKVFD